jgi:hypothetical protein
MYLMSIFFLPIWAEALCEGIGAGSDVMKEV